MCVDLLACEKAHYQQQCWIWEDLFRSFVHAMVSSLDHARALGDEADITGLSDQLDRIPLSSKTEEIAKVLLELIAEGGPLKLLHTSKYYEVISQMSPAEAAQQVVKTGPLWDLRIERLREIANGEVL